MSIFCLGVNHKTAPVEIRERLAFPEKAVPGSLDEIRELEGVDEAVVLSTCNRVEVYGAGDTVEAAADRVADYLLGHFGVDPNQVDFYRHEAEDAAHHLFEVASGLDSMVLGETEIFGQVKKAYATAQERGTTARRLNKLFQQSFRIGKLVRSSTRIQQGATSVGAVAVELAETIFGHLSECRVMIIGAGEMSRTTAQSLLSRGARSIIVSNRSHDRAEELAGELGGSALRFDEWETAIPEVDIVISSTSAPHAVIRAETIEKAMPSRKGLSLLLIDIAVPRDIEDEVDRIPNVYLYNIDNLQEIADEGRNRREKQIAVCREVIRTALEEKGIEALREGDEMHKKKDSGARGESSAPAGGRPLTSS